MMHAETLGSRPYAARVWSVEHDVGWERLNAALIPPAIRDALGRTYAQVLQAEQLGLWLVGALTDATPEGQLRDATREQQREEERHVVFFQRLSGILGSDPAPSVGLAALERELRGLRDPRSLMLYLQVLENAAHALFMGNGRQSLKRLQRGIRLPGASVVEELLHAIIGLVGKDEGRHLAFGMRALREQFVGIDARGRRVAEEQVQTACALVQVMVSELEGCFQALGFGRGEVAERVATAQARYFRHLELSTGLEAALLRSRERRP